MHTILSVCPTATTRLQRTIGNSINHNMKSIHNRANFNVDAKLRIRGRV